jgi:hypothetical protein
MTPYRIDRWLHYAKYIRSLTLTNWKDEDMIKLLEIAQMASGEPLFPNLADLIVHSRWLESDLGGSAITTFISSTIERLDVVGDSISDSLRIKTCLEAIKERSAGGRFRSLKMSFPSHPARQFEPCVPIIGALQDLRTIILPPKWITDKMFLVLMSLPFLDFLDVGSGSYVDSLDPTATPLIKSQGQRCTEDDFPSLSSLRLRAQWRTAIDIFENVFPCDHSLRSLTLCLTGDRCGDSEVLAQLIAGKFPGLQILSLESREMVDSPFLPALVRGMSLLDLSATSFRLSTEELGQMVGIWSRLNSLSLEYMPANYKREPEDFESLSERDLSGNGLQLDCLGDLANGCPSLEVLRITVYAGSTKHLAGLHSDTFRKLHSLTFCYSFLNYQHVDFYMLEAALYISSLFDARPPTLVFSIPTIWHFEIRYVEIPYNQRDLVFGLARTYMQGLNKWTCDMADQLNAVFAGQADLRRRLGIF